MGPESSSFMVLCSLDPYFLCGIAWDCTEMPRVNLIMRSHWSGISHLPTPYPTLDIRLEGVKAYGLHGRKVQKE